MFHFDEPNNVLVGDVLVKGLKISNRSFVEVIQDNVVVENVARMVLVELHVFLADQTTIVNGVVLVRVTLNNDASAEEILLVKQGTVGIGFFTEDEGPNEAIVFKQSSFNVAVSKERESRSASGISCGIVDKNDAQLARAFKRGVVAISFAGNQADLELVGLVLVLFSHIFLQDNLLYGGTLGCGLGFGWLGFGIRCCSGGFGCTLFGCVNLLSHGVMLVFAFAVFFEL